MKILLDENIPFAEELFGSLGAVTEAPGRSVDERYRGLDQFDALAIRSVTKVTPALVDRAVRCRVIATATIGVDHIDTAYIRQVNPRRERPITVVSAPGANADSVADYVAFALAHLAQREGRLLHGRSVGIIGCGNCGSRVARRARGMGMEVRRYDPPLSEREPHFRSDALAGVLDADFVTLHVPLTREHESAYPTWRMMGEQAFQRMKPEGYFLNMSRGAVVDSSALIQALQRGQIAGAALDVYEGEPEPPEKLIELPILATPHVAGYAVEAKRRGAAVIYRGICEALGVEPMDTEQLLRRGFDPPLGRRIEFNAGGGVEDAADRAICRLIAAIYDIDATSRELKGTLGSPERGKLFDGIRKRYRERRRRHELASYRVGFADSVPAGLRGAIRRRCEGFGAKVGGERPHFVLAPGKSFSNAQSPSAGRRTK
ncbi:MAG: 4-phosphoerythronate dehydrogenase [Planctomycetes bacterium]|nr:4-phosphoerythronate dehydrogenase [Planctomycetota bacterium]